MLTEIQYHKFRTFLHPRLHHAINPSYLEYQNYEELWRTYIHWAAHYLLNNPPEILGLVAMESAPGGGGHPHRNYIYQNLAHLVGEGDKYLVSIYNGAFAHMGLTAAGQTKSTCLEGLLRARTIRHILRPLVLFDLLPSHGIRLTTPYRKKQVATEGGFLPPDIISELDDRLTYINDYLLRPLHLTWGNVRLKFACPPTTMSVAVIDHLTIGYTGLTIFHPNLNVGQGRIPSAAVLASCIRVGGF